MQTTNLYAFDVAAAAGSAVDLTSEVWRGLRCLKQQHTPDAPVDDRAVEIITEGALVAMAADPDDPLSRVFRFVEIDREYLRKDIERPDLPATVRWALLLFLFQYWAGPRDGSDEPWFGANLLRPRK